MATREDHVVDVSSRETYGVGVRVIVGGAWGFASSGRVTDEAQAIESLGLKPRLVPGSRENLKVTWPDDLALAEAILARRA